MNPQGMPPHPGWNGPPPPGPGGWQPGPPAKPPRNYLWLVIAATVVIVIASVTIIVVSTTGGDDATTTASTSTSQRTSKASVPKSTTPKSSTRPPAPPPPAPAAPVDPALLKGLLATPEEAAGVFGVPTMEVSGEGTDAIGGDSPIPLECRAVWAPVHKETYDGSGYTAIARQSVKGTPDNKSGTVEAVVSFPDAAAAQATVDKVVAQWNRCPELAFTEKYRGADVNWRTGVIAEVDGIHTQAVFPQSRIDSPNTSTDPYCERAITARRNVVVDLLSCSDTYSAKGYMLAKAIAEKVDAAP